MSDRAGRRSDPRVHPRTPPDYAGGFTLIELMVVVMVIGVLAAIAIPVYLGVQNNSRDTAVKSDLVHYKNALIGAAADRSGAIPSTVSAAGSATIASVAVPLAPYGFTSSASTASLTYMPSGSLWCVDGVSTSTKAFRVSSNTAVAVGTCAALTSAAY